MPEVPEYIINAKLAEILSKELGIDARAERSKSGKRPDISCFYNGLMVVIETSYSKSDAESDAKKRIEQGIADISIALWLKNEYRNIPEVELERAIHSSKFDVKIFVPRDTSGWFTDIDIPALKDIINSAVEFLVKEEEVTKLIEDVESKISEFINALNSIDTKREIYKGIYDILYRLYGFSIAEAEDPEVVFGQAALSILLSATFYEHIRNKHPELRPLGEYVKEHGALEGLRNALEDLLKVDYKVAVETTRDILKVLPPNASYRSKDLIDLGIKIAECPSLLRRDFAGRVYHKITGDIALRKGFATFYTEVPAAYILASLSLNSFLDLDVKEIHEIRSQEAEKIIGKIKSMKVSDFACGSGTLITASYNTMLRLATALKYYYELEDLDVDEIAKTIIEEGIYGIDALRYASQITALNLALLSPGNISKENIYTIYLGYIPKRKQAWLGSLELLSNGGRVGKLLTWIEGGLKGIAEKASLEGFEGSFTIPEKFDLIIMNPPFTRATGRTEKFGEQRGHFGFIADKESREKMAEAYERAVEIVKKELKSIAENSAKSFPNVIKDIIEGGKELELRQYLNIGQAGEGLLFLYLAYKYINNDGVIAFVLPRGLLAGVSWFLARVLLASKFHVKYIIVSSDSEKGYNFSEGTSLSETLVVAKRSDSADVNAETVFINLLSKPSTALEAMMLSEEIKSAIRQLKANRTALVEVGGARALILKVLRRQLLENMDNWNRFVAVYDDYLINLVVNNLLAKGEGDTIIDERIELSIPLIRFNSVISEIGVDAHQFHDHFSVVNTETAYPVIYGGGEDVRKKMTVKPNAHAAGKTERADEIFRKYASRLLVPDRIWWDTAHVIALYSEVPVLANIFYAVKLKVSEDLREYAEKALTLWFNTLWGILTVLFNREETKGAWTRLKLAQWRLLPVLDVTKLNPDALKRLAEVFDKYSKEAPARIPEQFDPVKPDPIRLGIDLGFLEAFNPSLDKDKAREELLRLYKRVFEAFKTWIGSEKESE